ncbi:MAG: DUF3291 domain-containing protein [Nevskia sp.]|nr:DUF3291 domain-containing protein [Nevskia sp.]
MPKHELAQLNIARMKAPLEDPLMADFAANLDRINALAEGHPGFRWRLKTDGGNATALRPFGEEMLVNLSVWRDLQSLRDYVFASDHVEIMKRRREWFERMEVAYVVFWWVPEGHRPSIEEARLRLETLQRLGPTAEAFTFRNPFPAPGSNDLQQPAPLLDVCPSA